MVWKQNWQISFQTPWNPIDLTEHFFLSTYSQKHSYSNFEIEQNKAQPFVAFHSLFRAAHGKIVEDQLLIAFVVFACKGFTVIDTESL